MNLFRFCLNCKNQKTASFFKQVYFNKKSVKIIHLRINKWPFMHYLSTILSYSESHSPLDSTGKGLFCPSRLPSKTTFFLFATLVQTLTRPQKMLDITLSTLSFPSATQSCIKFVHESVNCIRNNRKLVHQIDMTFTNNC